MATKTKDTFTMAEQFYEIYLKRELEKKYKGKVVAIEIESKEYFIGDTEISAYEQASRQHPDKTFCFLRIGEKACNVIGELDAS